MASQETAAAGRGEWPSRHSCGLGHGLRVSTSPTACGCVIRGMFLPFPGSSPLQEAAVTRGEEGLRAPGGIPSACLPRRPQKEWLAGPSCLCLLDPVERADCCAVRLVLPDLQVRKQRRRGCRTRRLELAWQLLAWPCSVSGQAGRSSEQSTLSGCGHPPRPMLTRRILISLFICLRVK